MSDLMSIILALEVVPMGVVLMLMTLELTHAPPSRRTVWIARAFASMLVVISVAGIAANLYWVFWGGLNG